MSRAKKNADGNLPRSPTRMDKHVGSRLRARRITLGMSQVKVAKALGVTFQQVQQYEKGANRVSAGRLERLSKLLLVPVGFFFEGAPETGMSSRKADSALIGINEFLATFDGRELSAVFTRIDDATVRRRIVELTRDLAQALRRRRRG